MLFFESGQMSYEVLPKISKVKEIIRFTQITVARCARVGRTESWIYRVSRSSRIANQIYRIFISLCMSPLPPFVNPLRFINVRKYEQGLSRSDDDGTLVSFQGFVLCCKTADCDNNQYDMTEIEEYRGVTEAVPRIVQGTNHEQWDIVS